MSKFWHKRKSNISKKIKIGKNCIIHSHVVIYDDVYIGDNCKIQSMVFIPNGVVIDDDVFIGPGVVFTNDKHPPSNGSDWRSTFVRSGVSIGANATILPGITIGKDAVIGAGAVVTKSVPANEVWAGNPAKKIK